MVEKKIAYCVFAIGVNMFFFVPRSLFLSHHTVLSALIPATVIADVPTHLAQGQSSSSLDKMLRLKSASPTTRGHLQRTRRLPLALCSNLCVGPAHPPPPAVVPLSSTLSGDLDEVLEGLQYLRGELFGIFCLL